MLKLVQFNPVVGFGSTGRIVEQIGQFVQSKGWQSHIVYSGRPQGHSRSNLIQVGTSWDTYNHAIQTRLFDKHGLYSTNATRKLVQTLEKIEPDVIHFHNIHGYYLNYEIIIDYVNAYDIPVIWTFHDFWPITGHCSYFSDVECEKWKKTCFDCPKTSFYPKSYVDNSTFNFKKKKEVFTSIKNLTVTPVSEWAASLVRASFLANADIKPIYNGIDLGVFKQREFLSLKVKYGLQGKLVLLALATTWGKRKGWDDYIALAKRLNADTALVMIGVTEKQAKELPANVKTIKRTNDLNELVDWYNIADIVMNLSYQETFGLTTVEGFACGTPSIVYNRTASPELMTDDVGEVVEAGDIDGVVQAIQKIRLKGKESYMNACLGHVRDKFDANDRYADYLALYKEKLDGRKF